MSGQNILTGGKFCWGAIFRQGAICRLCPDAIFRPDEICFMDDIGVTAYVESKKILLQNGKFLFKRIRVEYLFLQESSFYVRGHINI